MKTVLVVDDHATLRGAVAALIERMGFDVVERESVRSGVDALEELSLEGCDLAAVVSDYDLGDGKGTKILGLACEVFPMAHRIMMSGGDGKERGAAHHFIEKPFSNELLCGLLRAGPGVLNESDGEVGLVS